MITLIRKLLTLLAGLMVIPPSTLSLLSSLYSKTDEPPPIPLRNSMLSRSHADKRDPKLSSKVGIPINYIHVCMSHPCSLNSPPLHFM